MLHAYGYNLFFSLKQKAMLLFILQYIALCYGLFTKNSLTVNMRGFIN